MGNLATPEALLHRWEEMQPDPSLQDLPYRIELNAWGKVECPILTDIGIRVPDLAWASPEFMRQHAGISPLPRVPAVCVEVISPSKVAAEITEKTRAYLAAGAQEISLSSPDLTKGYP